MCTRFFRQLKAAGAIGIPLLLLAGHTLFAQTSTISGKVYDRDSGDPLPGVNVFVAHSTLGSATDVRGTFEIDGVPPGSYELVASMVGFVSESRRMDVQASSGQISMDYRLAPDVYELSGIEATAERDRSWERQFDEFRRRFLGQSGNARQTSILNKFALDFQTDRTTRVLTASAPEPLEIENRALGYRIRFVLQQFRWDPHAEKLDFEGLPYFENLTPEDDQEWERWQENRQLAWAGSLPHLFRTMSAGRSFEEGFSLRLEELTGLRSITENELLTSFGSESVKELSFPGVLKVTFEGSGGSGGFLRRRQIRLDYGIQMSSLFALVSQDGFLTPASVLVTQNYDRRIAELLPRDYQPGDQPEPEAPVTPPPAIVTDLQSIRGLFFVTGERLSSEAPSPPDPEIRQVLLDIEDAQWSNASTLLESRIQSNEDDLEARYLLGITLRERARDFPGFRTWNRAIEEFEYVSRRDSLFRDALLQLAVLRSYDEDFEDAVELAELQHHLRPDLPHVSNGILQLYRTVNYSRSGRRARRWLNGRKGPFADYARAERLRLDNQPDEAEKILDRLVDENTALPVQAALLSLARLQFAEGATESAQAMVDAAIDSVSTLSEGRLVFDDFKYVVHNHELETYRRLRDVPSVRHFLRGFWTKRDPVPAASANVRLAEHYRRLFEAERQFVHTGMKVWQNNPDRLGELEFPPAYHLNDLFNDKGLIYLRLGEPEDLVIQQGTVPELLSPDEESNLVEPNESWRYNNPRLDFHFGVQGGGNNWRLIPVLQDDPHIRYSRGHWGGMYSAIASSIIQNSRASSLRGGLSDETFQNEMRDASAEAVMVALDSDRHTWSENTRLFQSNLFAAAFRDPDGLTRLELHYALPIGQIRESLASDADSIYVELGVAVHDTLWRPAFHLTSVEPFPVASGTNAAIAGMLSLSAPPDSFHVSFHARPENTSLLSTTRFSIGLPDFSGPELMLSDLLPAFRILEQSDGTDLRRSDLQLVPNPYSSFRTDRPLAVFFEIYGLALENGWSDFTVDYTLREADTAADPVLTLRSDRSGLQASAIAFTSMDVSDLPLGDYVLDATVADRVSGAKVSRRLHLTLSPPG